MTNKQKKAIAMAQLEQKIMDATLRNARDSRTKARAVFVYNQLLDRQTEDITEKSSVLIKTREKKKKLIKELEENNDRREKISEYYYVEKDGNYFKIKTVAPRTQFITQDRTTMDGPKGRKNKTRTIEDIEYTPITLDVEDHYLPISKSVYDGFTFEREQREAKAEEIRAEIRDLNKVWIGIVANQDAFKQYKDRFQILEKQINRGDYYLETLDTERPLFDALEFDTDENAWIPILSEKTENNKIKISPINKSIGMKPKVNPRESDLFEIIPEGIKKIPQNIKDGVGAVRQSIQKKMGDVFKGQPITDSMGKNQTQVEAQANAKMLVMQNKVLKNQNNNVSGNNLKKINV